MDFPRANFSHVDTKRTRNRITPLGGLLSGSLQQYEEMNQFTDGLQERRFQGAVRGATKGNDFTTQEGQRGLLGNLSQQGYGPEAIGLSKQLPDLRNPAQDARKQAETAEEARLGSIFQTWRDGVAIPYLQSKGNKLAPADRNELYSTVPSELLEHPATKSLFGTLQNEPAPKAPPRPNGPRPNGGRASTTNPEGIARNIEEIDQDLAEAEAELEGAEANKPGARDYAATKENFETKARLRKQVESLKKERRGYQAKTAPKSGSGARKLTDTAKAREYLDKAGGDANKAREMARRDGWTF